MHIVPVKSIEQHSMPCVHRLREGLKADWVACINRIRGLLADWATLSRRINIRYLGPHCKHTTRSERQGRFQKSSLFLVHAPEVARRFGGQCATCTVTPHRLAQPLPRKRPKAAAIEPCAGAASARARGRSLRAAGR